jgi:hypothetical protein
MKNIFYLFLAIILFTSCLNGNKEDNLLITIDLSKNYPQNDAIPIQKLGKVEYIPLETNNDFLCDERNGTIFINNELIIFYDSSNYDFLIFSGNGKALSKFNKKGQGPEDYLTTRLDALYDNKRQELFINSMGRFLKIYDLQGHFKRQLINFNDFISEVSYKEFSLLNENILLYSSARGSSGITINKFILFSKESGEKVKEKIAPYNPIAQEDFSSGDQNDLMMKIYDRSEYFPQVIKKYNLSFYNNEYWSDTISEFSEDLSTQTPVIVRNPSVFAQDYKGLLFLDLVTQDYYF